MWVVNENILDLSSTVITLFKDSLVDPMNNAAIDANPGNNRNIKENGNPVEFW